MIYRALCILFGLLTAARFAYPFLVETISRQTGLSNRQWKQAGTFFNPDHMGGVDGFLYQPWLAAVRWISDDAPWMVHSFCGLLCAALPVCWWLCARELLPRSWAIVFGIAVAITPSFLTIYGYFSSETLLLPLIGLACWQSAVCWRTRSRRSFVFAAIFWALATYTRVVALPPGVACLLLLWWRIELSPLAAAATLCVYALIGTAAALYSHKAIGVYTPFGMPQMNAVLARADTPMLYIYFDGKRRWFRSPSYFQMPMAPLSDWQIRPRGQSVYVHLDTKRGWQSWRDAMASFPLTREVMLRQIQRNVTMLLFASSWPEAWPDKWKPDATHIAWEDRLNHHARWMWAPLIVFVVALGWRVRDDSAAQGIIALTLLLVALLSFQSTAVMEGRYRKPVEPLLMLSAAIIIQRQLTTGRKDSA